MSWTRTVARACTAWVCFFTSSILVDDKSQRGQLQLSGGIHGITINPLSPLHTLLNIVQLFPVCYCSAICFVRVRILGVQVSLMQRWASKGLSDTASKLGQYLGETHRGSQRNLSTTSAVHRGFVHGCPGVRWRKNAVEFLQRGSLLLLPTKLRFESRAVLICFRNQFRSH